MTEIIVAGITGLATVLAVMLTNSRNLREMDARLQTVQAVMKAQLEELTREVREHNGFAKRMPVLEEKMSVANHRIDDLERRTEK